MTLLIGPFTQLLTMDKLGPAGPLSDDQLQICEKGGIIIDDGKLVETGPFAQLSKKKGITIHEIPFPAVALPGFIDAHTHLCFAGTRASDYEKRLNGLTYQEIAAQGGGILETVRQTRAASTEDLVDLMLKRSVRLLETGVTTCEVKSGYGLSTEQEIKMLSAIQKASQKQPVALIPTCLAAHTKPPEFSTNREYLDEIAKTLFPTLKAKALSSRIDIFVDKGAFTPEEARRYLHEAKKWNFDICLHADQFTRGGSRVAAEVKALSADHLECSTREDLEALKENGVIPVALPGCSLGLGLPFAPAREMLDCGLPLAIASDWNPGSAPMGYLLAQAAVLGAAQRLTMAETLAAITIRAARALNLKDRGSLIPGSKADFVVFKSSDFREILYYQGSLLPAMTWIGGNKAWAC